MAARVSWLLPLLPLLAACQGGSEPLGTTREATTICPTGSTLQGVDVSTYDGALDWSQIKGSGVAFAIAKATEGTTFTDSTFATNWAGMKQAGVIRSAYHFFHANVDPMEQASFFLSVMGPLSPGDLPPSLDLEVNDNEPAETVIKNAVIWLDAVAAATGTKPIIYTSTRVVNEDLGGDPAGLQDHGQLWVANWQVTCPDVPPPFTGWAIWQYSATGTVPGFPAGGNVDLDQFNGDLAALQSLTVGGSSSGSADGGDASCTVGGVTGTCLDTAICGLMTGYTSTPGYCPGPTNVQCCTSTGGSGSSSTSSSGGGTTSSSSTSSSGSNSGGATGGAGTGGAGTGGGSSSGHMGAGTSSGCAAAPQGEGAGTGARAMLAVIAALSAAAGRSSPRRRRRA